MYARMVELSLIQRASILKFSDEVTRLSELRETNESDLADRISDFYREYIRFVNQVYFREVTAQEQGIEMYDMIQEKMKISSQVSDLDNEISELHQYATLIEDKKRNKSLSLLTMIGAIFIIPSFIAGFYGMNFIDITESPQLLKYSWIILVSGILLAPAMVVVYLRKRSKKNSFWLLIISALFILTSLLLFFFLK
jgi:Mg2+ and Co2+ transporter CorA